MNIKSFIITVIVAFIAVWATDFLIHAVWLGETYKATEELWRPEEEMMAMMPWMFAGQFVIGAVFVWIFASFVAEKRSLGKSLQFGLAMGTFSAGAQLIMYVVQPYPGDLVAKWVGAYLVQGLVIGLIVHLVYKPANR